MDKQKLQELKKLRKNINTQKKESIDILKKYIKKDITIHSIIRNVSVSGMSRNISFKVIDKKELLDLSWHISKALEYPFNDKKHAIKVSGCGMDMAFHVVHNLSHVLFNNGYKLKSKII